MNAVKVPATVQGVLAARIDRLPPEDKELLQTLAVMGREFPLGLVKHVSRRPDEELEHDAVAFAGRANSSTSNWRRAMLSTSSSMR